ncbi:MAG: hypothetical protein GMKNLPBB_00410 [Myxococcota bacterium]|nr:hypothetical protein [Myxococcota bacterium]
MSLAPAESGGHPWLPFAHLDTLWLQVTGTVCNIACRHCFISCGPKNHAHEFLSLAEVRGNLARAGAMGVKEIYFTGGEPFLHPEIFPMIEAALAVGPLTILTNGMRIDETAARRLGEVFRASRYSFDLRISLDGRNAAENDAVRGKGCFDAVIKALRLLAGQGVNPVLTVTEVSGELAPDLAMDDFLRLLRDAGLTRPRIKFLAPFRIGREARRSGPYDAADVIREGEASPDDVAALQCASSRMVTSKGVYTCPILINQDDARLGDTLEEASRPFRLKWSACATCLREQVSCRT